MKLKNILILIVTSGVSILNLFLPFPKNDLPALLMFSTLYFLVIRGSSFKFMFFCALVYLVLVIPSFDVRIIFACSYPLIMFSLFFLFNKLKKNEYAKLLPGMMMNSDDSLVDLLFTIASFAVIVSMCWVYYGVL